MPQDYTSISRLSQDVRAVWDVACYAEDPTSPSSNTVTIGHLADLI